MKKLFLALMVMALAIGIVSPAQAAPPLVFNTWVHTSQGLVPNYPTGWAFAFPPDFKSDRHGVAFVGTSSQGDTSGLFQSSDSGITWNGTAQLNATWSLSISPNYATDHLMAAGTASAGVWKTTNSWATPTDITGALPDSAVSVVAFSPNYAIDHQLFAATRSKGVFMTVNLGTTWAHIGPGGTPDDSRITAMGFTPDYAANHTLFIAASAEGSGLSGIFKGVWNLVGSDIHWTWTRLVSGLTDLDLRVLVISPNYANDLTLYAGTYGGGLFKSSNSGSSWSFVDGTESLYVQALAISPDYAYDRSVYMGEDGSGVYRYVDLATDPYVTQMNAGFPDAVHGGSITSLAFAPGLPRILFAGVLGGSDGGVWQFLFPIQQYLPLVRK